MLVHKWRVARLPRCDDSDAHDLVRGQRVVGMRGLAPRWRSGARAVQRGGRRDAEARVLPRAGQAEGYGVGWGSGLAVAVLCLILVSRVADVVAVGRAGQVPFTVALFVLPLLYAVRPRRLARYRWPVLAVQAVLTWVPFAVFGGQWQLASAGCWPGWCCCWWRARCRGCWRAAAGR